MFTISIRKDIDTGFEFPEPEELKLRLKDILEKDVDEKYYLDDKKIEKIKSSTFAQERLRIQEKDYCDTILARDWKDPKCVQIGKLDIKGHDCVKRVYSGEGISPTLTDMQGGNRQPKIITYNITQKVKIREYPVNIDKLKELLRNAKSSANMTNTKLAEKLEIPVTQVEHYFRKDKCFAIPDPEIWYKLKELLKIDTDEFDESIMTFEEKDGVYDKANRVYDEQGLAPTLTQQEEKIVERTPLKFLNRNQKNIEGDYAFCVDSCNTGGIKEIQVIGNYMPSNHDASRIVDVRGIAPTVKENHGTVTAIIEGQSGLIQPTDRKYKEHKTERKEHIEFKDDNCSHALRTSVVPVTCNNLRIRKLTPKECWRLMGFTDEDFEKAQKVPMSNTQLYKQARELNSSKCIRKNI